MNHKAYASRAGDLALCVKILAVVVLFIALVCVVDTHLFNQRNPSYVRLEGLQIETMLAVKTLKESRSIPAQRKVNEKFDELKRVAQVTPEEFIPLQVKQLIEDQPRYTLVRE